MLDYKAYAGIGSRKTPINILGIMSVVAYYLAKEGWTLRSGCAQGADSAFEAGAEAAVDSDGTSRPELYLPWSGFEGRKDGYVHRTDPQPEAYDIARQYHPNWANLSDDGRKLHARNVHQVMGYNLLHPHPVTFIICWTPEGKGGGGTGQALRIARGLGINEIYDLAIPENLKKIKEFIPQAVM